MVKDRQNAPGVVTQCVNFIKLAELVRQTSHLPEGFKIRYVVARAHAFGYRASFVRITPYQHQCVLWALRTKVRAAAAPMPSEAPVMTIVCDSCGAWLMKI